jgi:exopolyphosphatase/guanosine-5'-triphosphate,3'-diphosphate pyrophosphatase
MVTTGRLHEDGIALALEALSRFRVMADALGVHVRQAVATAAARDAQNGRDFVAAAEKAWGAPVRVLSGAQEAGLAAEGVLSAIPGADGLVADLGGGSLDMSVVRHGVPAEAMTLPFGPLRLMDRAEGNAEKARRLADEGLKPLSRLCPFGGRSLYAVGGIWRSLARVDMEDIAYPLHVLHHYVIPRTRAIRLCRAVAGLSRKSLERMKVVPKRRAEALPYGAVVLERLLAQGGFKAVVISAAGLREGLLFAALPPEERAQDPLIAFAAAVNGRAARAPAHAEEMFAWTAPLFADEEPELARVRRAACLFSDTGWRRHPDDRAFGAFNQVLTAPFAGADHRARALIATATYHRYRGDEDFPRELMEAGLLSDADERRARRYGLAARLAFALSASAAGELPRYRLELGPARLVLGVPPGRARILGDPVQKRLAVLAESLGRKGEIVLD